MFSVVQLLVIIHIVNGEIEYIDYDLKVEDRPLPPDLKDMFTNKTRTELEYEECMSEYVLCISHSKTEQICAQHATTLVKNTFRDICEMTYENCKVNTYNWVYFYDGECQQAPEIGKARKEHID